MTANALQYVAPIARSIITNRLDLTVKAPGLKAIYDGLTIIFAENVILQQRSTQHQQVTT